MAEKKDNSILEKARKFRDEASDYWDEIYERGRHDKEFAVVKGAQWDKSAVDKRMIEGKPVLEFNLVHTYCRQQINTHRQNRPQIQVVPVDSGADSDTAKILSGLIKDTEEASDFENTNDQAVENAVYGGMGFLRILTDYVSEDSFNQEPQYKTIFNPEAVYIDPLSRELDGSDNTRALVCEWVSKDAVITQYGKDAISDFDMPKVEQWFDSSNNTVLIAEYFWKEEVKDTLLRLHDDSVVFKSEAVKKWSEDELALVVIQERETTRTEVKWAKLSGCKVLEEGIFPGKHIPIVPVYGEVVWVGDKREVFSLVHFAKDPQRLFNYWKSTEASILNKNQDEMLVVDADAIDGYEEWDNPEKYARLRYKYIDETGKQTAPPQKIGTPTPPVGILNAADTARALIADTLNMHSPQMGEQINNQSGRAIGMLQRQGETSQFHFQDNNNKSIRHCGRILLGLYQILYDTQQVKRIIGTDGEAEMVALNAPPKKPDEFEKAIDGLLNNLSIGRYDVRMDTGPSFNTQREQSFQLMMQLAQYAPNIMEVAGDLIIKDSPLINSKDIAERVKKMMPPQVLGDEGQINPEQAKAQIMQLDEVVQKLTGELEALQQQVTDKTAQHNLEMFKAELDSQTKIQVAQIDASSRADVQELRGVVELLKQQVNAQNVPEPWLQQGEGVDNYKPQDLPPQADEGFEPPPDFASQSFNNPPSEGFLMSEQTAQPNFALDPDRIEDSALIENEQLILPNEGSNGSE